MRTSKFLVFAMISFSMSSLAVGCQAAAHRDEQEALRQELQAAVTDAKSLKAEVDTVRTEVAALRDEITALRARPSAPESPAAAGVVVPRTAAQQELAELAANAIHCEGDRCTVKRELLTKLQDDPSLLVRQARIVPNHNGEQMMGVRLYGMRSDSVLRRLGFQNGDTIQAMNGSPIVSAEEALKAYESITTASTLSFTFERGGEQRTLTIAINE